MRPLTDNALKDLLVNNSGDPGDKSTSVQWYNVGRIIGTERQQLSYMFDRSPGQSGSWIWRYDKTRKKRPVIGMHNFGGCPNRSTWIKCDVVVIRRAWKALEM